MASEQLSIVKAKLYKTAWHKHFKVYVQLAGAEERVNFVTKQPYIMFRVSGKFSDGLVFTEWLAEESELSDFVL